MQCRRPRAYAESGSSQLIPNFVFQNRKAPSFQRPLETQQNSEKGPRPVLTDAACNKPQEAVEPGNPFFLFNLPIFLKRVSIVRHKETLFSLSELHKLLFLLSNQSKGREAAGPVNLGWLPFSYMHGSVAVARGLYIPLYVRKPWRRSHTAVMEAK